MSLYHTSLHQSLGSAKVAVQNNPVRPWETSGFPICASIWSFSLLLLLSFILGVVMYIIQSFNLTSHDVIVYEGQNIRVVFQLREEHSEESLNIICANLYSYLFNITLDLIDTVKTSRSPLRLLTLQYSLPWGNKLCIKQFTAVWRTTSQRDS